VGGAAGSAPGRPARYAAFVLLLLLACPAATSNPTDTGCVDGPTLFGTPEPATGLDASACGPTCSCVGEQWAPPTYTDADFAALLTWEFTAPYAEVTDDPYLLPAPEPPTEGAVCAFVHEGGSRYSLAGFASTEAARFAGAVPTHAGSCGVCSTLADLAVYMSVNDLTEPVRACGLDNLGGTAEEHLACLAPLGFTRACAWIWYWNTLNTRDACLGECLAAIDAPYNEPDGSLNPCLACDEEESGPVFKAVAGRTRRNTGLPNAICRPCGEVLPIEHVYP
jgi:hypothetical protein